MATCESQSRKPRGELARGHLPREAISFLPMMDRMVIMVGGKGGTGKTTCSSAIAMEFARRGKRTLLLSTDPTPSLADIFLVKRSPGRKLSVVPHLEILEMSQGQLVEMWDKKFGREVYEVFSALVDISYEEFVEFISSVLPGLAEEFLVDQIREMASVGTYEKIIWDTAPMGQTLSLLRTPSLLREHLRPAPRIYSRLRLGERSKRSILATISKWAELSEMDLHFLRTQVEIVLVAIPEALAVEQLGGILGELYRHQLLVSALIVNQVISEVDSPFLGERARQQRLHLERMFRDFPQLEMRLIPLFSQEIRGQEGLDQVRRALFGHNPPGDMGSGPRLFTGR